jgi:hypothetical protein
LPPTETSAIENSPHKNKTVIVPTTYSPPKFFLKSLLPKPVTYSTTVPNLSESKPENKPHKTLKSVRKLISPINVNYGLSVVTGSSFESAEKLVSEVDSVRNILPYRRSHAAKSRPSDYFDESTTKTTKPSTLEHLTSSSESITHIVPGVKDSSDELIDDDYTSREETKLRHYVEPYTDSYNVSSEAKRFRTTIEIPPPHDLIDDYQKLEPDQSPDYKLQPFPKPIALTTTTTKTTTTDSPHNTSIPARVSRVNTAIKSLIAFGGTRRQNVKCHENQSADSKCNDPKHQRYLFLVK